MNVETPAPVFVTRKEPEIVLPGSASVKSDMAALTSTPCPFPCAWAARGNEHHRIMSIQVIIFKDFQGPFVNLQCV
jgi:hypothetical protein